jgi:hypothetical protein
MDQLRWKTRKISGQNLHNCVISANELLSLVVILISSGKPVRKINLVSSPDGVTSLILSFN